MKILITGFESRDEKSNASDIVVTSLKNDMPKGLQDTSSEIIMSVLGDDTHTLKEELLGLLKKYQPDYCLFTGQAPSRNKITLEHIATNYRYTSPPPSAGEPAEGGKIEEGGPDAYLSTLPDMPAIVKELKENIIPAVVSRWGGNSLCNQVLYHGLHYAKENNKNIKCGFVHIPALPEQVISLWPDVPFMPLEMTRKAIEVTVKSVLRQ